jgi:hypothetical protein
LILKEKSLPINLAITKEESQVLVENDWLSKNEENETE